MIQLVNRIDLNIKKYDACVEKSPQKFVFAFSWYLDICCDNWAVLVLDDYIAVMPIPFRKKYGIKYVYPPLWILQLGIFTSDKKVREDDFIVSLQKHFKYVELRLNTYNKVAHFTSNKQMQVLSLEDDYKTIFNNYNRNRKRELAKAKKHDLVENWNDNPKKLIELYKNNIANRVQGISITDFENLRNLIEYCIEKRVGEMLTIYTSKNELVSAAFFIKYKNKVTQVVCASDLKNRDNGANTFSNDRAIFKYQQHFGIYDFGGSSMKNIAKYYKSFAAKTETYSQLKFNKLPLLFQLFKR